MQTPSHGEYLYRMMLHCSRLVACYRLLPSVPYLKKCGFFIWYQVGVINKVLPKGVLLLKQITEGLYLAGKVVERRLDLSTDIWYINQVVSSVLFEFLYQLRPFILFFITGNIAALTL